MDNRTLAKNDASRIVNLAIKRLFDELIGCIALIIMSPIFLITTVLIKLTMPGRVFFCHERVGRNGRMFTILKFRTMRVDLAAEKNHDDSKDKERTTPLGKVLRRTKIDELPQIINVIKGDMSLVGPRPTFAEQVELYTANQRRRLDMRPGMTGLAQVNGNILLAWDERIEYDIKYVEEFSILLDLWILLKTVGVIVCGEGRFTKSPSAEA